jgi:hypothetical protein
MLWLLFIEASRTWCSIEGLEGCSLEEFFKPPVFTATTIATGAGGIVPMVAKGRVRQTLWNVGYILDLRRAGALSAPTFGQLVWT